ncbi:zinc-ribbon domain-containing protein [Streptomyces sp. NPDC059371]|uniref:zinc-ribbon domain-containing protein n=1 Tax=Streptomyces sp. NPDC059371 TaxID=3346812 RepID=UPI0036AE0EA6
MAAAPFFLSESLRRSPGPAGPVTPMNPRPDREANAFSTLLRVESRPGTQRPPGRCCHSRTVASRCASPTFQACGPPLAQRSPTFRTSPSSCIPTKAQRRAFPLEVDSPAGGAVGKPTTTVWEAPAYRRAAAGTGCPFCVGKYPSKTNSLASLCRGVATELDLEARGAPATAGLTADRIVAGSHRKVGWRCSTCDHRWVARVGPRTRPTRGRLPQLRRPRANTDHEPRRRAPCRRRPVANHPQRRSATPGRHARQFNEGLVEVPGEQ